MLIDACLQFLLGVSNVTFPRFVAGSFVDYGEISAEGLVRVTVVHFGARIAVTW